MSTKLIQRNDGMWLVQFYEGSKRRRLSTGTRDKKDARARMTEVAAGQAVASAPRPPVQTPARNPILSPESGDTMTMGQLLDRCRRTVWSEREGIKSQRTVSSNVKILSEMIGDEPITAMTYPRLERLKDELFAKGYAAGTVKGKLHCISKALTMATKWVGADDKPLLTGKPAMPEVVSNSIRDRILNDIEEAALFAAIDRRIKAEPMRDWKRFRHLMTFLLNTGCRLGEALGITERSVKTTHATIMIQGEKVEAEPTFVTFARYMTKNDKPRTLALSDEVIEALPYLKMNASPDGRLFPLKAATAWYMFKTVRSDLKLGGVDISDVVLHSLRHTCITRLCESGEMSLDQVADYAGHSSTDVTRKFYRHLRPDESLRAVSIINNLNRRRKDGAPTAI